MLSPIDARHTRASLQPRHSPRHKFIYALVRWYFENADYNRSTVKSQGKGAPRHGALDPTLASRDAHKRPNKEKSFSHDHDSKQTMIVRGRMPLPSSG
jgi:hypothetical protein